MLWKQPSADDCLNVQVLCLSSCMWPVKQRLLVVPVPQLAISATELRQRVAEGRPIKYQTPEAVERYIAEHGLYLH